MVESGISPVEIVTACDDHFAPPLGVMLTSLFENSRSRDRIHVNIIDGGISPENKEKLLHISEKYLAPFHFLTIDKVEFKGLITRDHLNSVAYYRLAIPDLLDETIIKALYLDCDMVIKDDISYLWDLDISTWFLAAVESVGIERGGYLQDTKERLNIPVGSTYFNSGVMVMNLPLWRRGNIHHSIIQFIARNPDKIRLADQDGLNAFLYDKWLPLPIRWNQERILHKIILTCKDPGYLDAINAPGIIHFTGASKPWHYLDKHPLKNEYFYYRARTEWKIVHVSAILPVFNEDLIIDPSLARIQGVFNENTIHGEIIVMDMSADRTAGNLQMSGTRVIHLEKGGFGNAYREVFRHAQGEYIVVGDPDGSYDFLEIVSLLAAFRTGADLVIGSRFEGTIHPGSMTALYQYIIAPLLIGLINRIFKTRFSDAFSGLWAIKTESLDRLTLNTKGIEFGTVIFIRASLEKMRIKEIPINYYPCRVPSKRRSFTDVWKCIRFVLSR